MKRSMFNIGLLSLTFLFGLSILDFERTQDGLAQARGGFTYTVKRGDTLFILARRFGTTPTRLRQYNGLAINALRLGQKIRIPGGNAGGGASQPTGGGVSPKGRVDSDLLARVIRAEAEAEPYVGQVAVGAVILNRIDSPKFPNSLSGVVYQPHAFESVSNGTANRAPTASTRKAAQSAIQGWDPSGGAIFFFAPAKTSNRFIWSRKIIQRIGKHVFAI